MYVVAGVTGRTGRVAAEILLARNQAVRALVHDESKAGPWRAKGAEGAVVSMEDAQALATAFQGARGAYVLVQPQCGAPELLAAQGDVIGAIGQAAAGEGRPRV